jgi:hypothetical protein
MEFIEFPETIQMNNEIAILDVTEQSLSTKDTISIYSLINFLKRSRYFASWGILPLLTILSPGSFHQNCFLPSDRSYNTGVFSCNFAGAAKSSRPTGKLNHSL